MKIVNGFQLLNVLAKTFIIDVWQVYKYPYDQDWTTTRFHRFFCQVAVVLLLFIATPLIRPKRMTLKQYQPLPHYQVLFFLRNHASFFEENVFKILKIPFSSCTGKQSQIKCGQILRYVVTSNYSKMLQQLDGIWKSSFKSTDVYIKMFT